MAIEAIIRAAARRFRVAPGDCAAVPAGALVSR